MAKSASRHALRAEGLERRELLTAVDALRISEIMYHPADPPSGAFVADDYEFIELVNIGASPVSLANVEFDVGISFDFATSAISSLAAGERLLLVKNVSAFESRYGAGLPIAGAYGGQLANGGEELRLMEGASVVQTVVYADDWRPVTDGDGFSLTVIDPAAPAAMWSNAANYRGSLRGGGSPGGVEAPLAANAVVINELLAHTDENLGDWVELHNTTDQAINIADWYLSDKATELNRYRIAGDKFIPAGGYLTFTQFATFDDEDDPGALVPFGFSEFGETAFVSSWDSTGLAASYQTSQSFRASDREVTFGRYTTSTGELEFIEQAAQTFNAPNGAPLVGPVVITEINYNQPGSGAEHEFIELHNRTNAEVLLYDPLVPANTWKFTNGIDFVMPQGTSIPANGYLVVTAVTPAAFRAANDVPANVTVLGPWLGGLDKNGEALTLSRPGDPELDGTVPYYRTDHVKYSDVAPWPTQPDGDGPSLVREAADLFGNDPANWIAGATTNGTPGRGEENVLLPGDTNGDGSVDLVDLNNVRNHFGEVGTGVVGDSDGNGIVDLSDLNAVRNNFGAVLSPPTPAASTARRPADRLTALVAKKAALQDAALGELLHEWATVSPVRSHRR